MDAFYSHLLLSICRRTTNITRFKRCDIVEATSLVSEKHTKFSIFVSIKQSLKQHPQRYQLKDNKMP